ACLPCSRPLWPVVLLLDSPDLDSPDLDSLDLDWLDLPCSDCLPCASPLLRPASLPRDCSFWAPPVVPRSCFCSAPPPCPPGICCADATANPASSATVLSKRCFFIWFLFGCSPSQSHGSNGKPSSGPTVRAMMMTSRALSHCVILVRSLPAEQPRSRRCHCGWLSRSRASACQ